MAENSKIQWTHHTANLWWGCTKVHAGCDNCYAEALAHRFGDDVWGNDKPRRMVKSVWSDLAKYQRKAKEAGEMHRVFVGSMMDIFEKEMPVVDSNGKSVYSFPLFGNKPKKGSVSMSHVDGSPITTGFLRATLFTNIELGFYPNLIFLFLTKRPSNINKYIPDAWKNNPPKNVWFGTSPADQETADKLIPQLLDVNGNHFLSVEPMLGPVDITRSVRIWRHKTYKSFHSTFFGDKIQWVICGGESGPGKRPFNPEWARSLREQCVTAESAFFMKQIDKVQPIPEDLMIRQFPVYGQRNAR